MISRPKREEPSLQEALRTGKETYFTGKPCKRGHLSERRTSNSVCIQCCTEIYKARYTEKYRNSENTFIHQFNARRQKALRDGIPFTISLEDIERPEFCPVLGMKLNYGCSKERGKTGLSGRDEDKATIDKLKPELGYVPGNVFIISWRANKLKSNMTIDELEKILHYMRRTNGKAV